MTEERTAIAPPEGNSEAVTSATPSGSLLDDTRLRWIESWAKGWRNALQARYGDKDYYAELPLDVAVSMIEELSAALRDPQIALRRLADTMESGTEIGEAVEGLRA